MADGGGWDDLFAKASGQETVKEEEEEQVHKEKSKRKKRKRSRSNNDRKMVLEGRMNVPSDMTTTTEWPQWARLGESMTKSNSNKKKECNGWKGTNHETCNTCGRSALFHSLQMNDSAVGVWPLKVFCFVRNLRCVGVLIAMEEVQANTLADFARSESNALGQIVKNSKLSLGAAARGEDQILDSKCQAVRSAVNAVLRHDAKKKKKQGDTVSDVFVKAVRLIIACDDMYYRLYYHCVSTSLPLGDGLNRLPHPAEYFHTPFLAWVGMERSLNDWGTFVESVCPLHNEGDRNQKAKLRNEIVARYGIDPSEANKLPKHTHVLSYLHNNRAMETARLFYKSGWTSTREAARQTMEALKMPVDANDDLSRHDTPAPPILSEWRDSCRDRLCNLYAYATVPNEAVERIRNDLTNAGIGAGVIEVGAGSGYLAALLKEAEIPVVAWDIHPPGSLAMNEYHGHTPGFCEISKGSPSDLRRHSATADAALLLCYPPPESPMAKEALEAYLDVGGRCLVHIGEFGGLTGSPAFERLLVRSCYCVDRFPCLAWGTDAAEVTVWIRADSMQGRRDQRLLLPCSSCGRAEASKRCRLVRHVAYCGQACFERHTTILTTHLAMNMIPIKAEVLNFDDDCHFIPIRTGKAGRGKK